MKWIILGDIIGDFFHKPAERFTFQLLPNRPHSGQITRVDMGPLGSFLVEVVFILVPPCFNDANKINSDKLTPLEPIRYAIAAPALHAINVADAGAGDEQELTVTLPQL